MESLTGASERHEEAERDEIIIHNHEFHDSTHLSK